MLQEWIQLIYVKGLTLAAKRKLVTVLGSPRAVLRADGRTVAGILGARAKYDASRRLACPDVAAELAVLERVGADFIGFDDADFPPLLAEIDSPPLGLFVLGDRTLLRSPQLAIVGSRRSTPSGRRTTAQFAGELSALGMTITSGLALGIDQCAHRGCLDAGGKTIAVTATGIDIAYPRDNRKLHSEIAARGCIVSEYPPGTPPKREYFPQRNRIISGLTLGTLVVEAGLPSGSLITARLAAEQGREVFAVPGSIHVPVARGCHYLLKQGAKLVEGVDDVLAELGQFFTPEVVGDGDSNSDSNSDGDGDRDAGRRSASPSPSPAGLGGDHARLYDMIDYTPAAIDQLIGRSGLTADKVSHILTELEIKGLIAVTAGGYQRLQS